MKTKSLPKSNHRAQQLPGQRASSVTRLTTRTQTLASYGGINIKISRRPSWLKKD